MGFVRLVVRAGLFLTAAGWLTSCGSDTSSEPAANVGAARIVFEPLSPAVLRGLSAQLTPTVIDSNSRRIAGAQVRWAALDPGLLTIDTNGVLHSVGNLGLARITASYQGIDTTVTIPILERVGTFEVRPESIVVNRGLRVDLEFLLLDKSGAPYGAYDVLGISTADSMIARLQGFSIIGGNRSGRTTVRLSIDTILVNIPVRVAQFPASISVTPVGINLSPGASQAVSVTVRDLAGAVIASPPVSFASEAPALLSVSSRGRITSKGPTGSGTVVVTSDTLVARVGVLVGPGRSFHLAHTAPINSNAYEAATGPHGEVVVTIDSTGAVLRGTLPGFTFPATLAVAASPRGVAVNHIGTHAYVASGNELSVLDLTQNTVLPPIPVPGGGAKIAVELSLNDQRAYLSTANQLYVIDLVQRTVLDSMPLHGALALAVHPTAARLYASPLEGDSISEIDLGTMTVVRTFHGGQSIKEIGLSPDGTQLYAADESAALLVFDLVSGRELQEVPLLANGFGLAVSANLIAVATFDGLEVFDRNSRVRLDALPLGGLPRRPAIGPGEGFIVVPNQGRWVDFIQ